MQYEESIQFELKKWQNKMESPPSLLNSMFKNVQIKWNNIIPKKIHDAVTMAVKHTTKAVIFGAGFTTYKNHQLGSLELIETKAWERVRFYRSASAAEGAVTGAGGFLLGMADFPLWLSLKMKMLFEIAAIYGHDVSDYKERLYILHIFQLVFSSQKHKNMVYSDMTQWDHKHHNLPEGLNEFDWRTFQLEYRDHIDLAKLLQLIPGIGALVGATVNHRLTNKLGKTAMNAYRMRRDFKS